MKKIYQNLPREVCVAEKPIPIPRKPVYGVGFNYAQRPLHSKERSKAVLLQFMKAYRGRDVFLHSIYSLN